MATALKLTFEQFQEQYGESNFEYWFGEAIPKGMPTWIHGLLQSILSQLLRAGDLIVASEVDLRIDPNAYPRPDVIASRTPPTGPYPTQGVDIVIEIISEDDKIKRLREKCTKYQEWGCGRIYIVDPGDRSVSEWRDGNMTIVFELAGVPVRRIWEALDRDLNRS